MIWSRRQGHGDSHIKILSCSACPHGGQPPHVTGSRPCHQGKVGCLSPATTATPVALRAAPAASRAAGKEAAAEACMEACPVPPETKHRRGKSLPSDSCSPCLRCEMCCPSPSPGPVPVPVPQPPPGVRTPLRLHVCNLSSLVSSPLTLLAAEASLAITRALAGQSWGALSSLARDPPVRPCPREPHCSSQGLSRLTLPCRSPVPLLPPKPWLTHGTPWRDKKRKNARLILKTFLGTAGFRFSVFLPFCSFTYKHASTFPTLSLKKREKSPPGKGI